MALWLVRAGKHGEQENYAIINNVAVIGWSEVPDLRGIASREALSDLLNEIYPNEKKQRLKSWKGSLWRFSRDISKGDIIALPLKSRSSIYIGEVTGMYEYNPNNPQNTNHYIPVRWIREFPRTEFDSDLRYSFGSLLAICGITRNNAESRVRQMLVGQTDKFDEDAEGIQEEELDIEQITQDQITTYIVRNFKGHDLSRLVGDLLTAQGFHVRVSPAGPDGGVDILAGSGPLGLESPKLAVQVKSGSSSTNTEVFRSFSGVMSRFRAEQGLIVAWSGFQGNVEREAVQDFFKIRLWDAGDLVRNLLLHYDKLPESTKAELPLKRIWMLVPEDIE